MRDERGPSTAFRPETARTAAPYACDVRRVVYGPPQAMVASRSLAGLPVTITAGVPDIASGILSALREAGAHARLAGSAGTGDSIFLLTEGFGSLSPAERHWRALLAARDVRAPGATIIFLEPADGTPASASGLGGLARSLRKEWPDVRVIAWTLATGKGDLASTVASALRAGIGDAHITGDAQCRYLQIDALLPPPSSVAAPRGNWLITGGARGVTAACAIELARRAGPGARLILAGRSATAAWPAHLPHTHDLRILRTSLANHARETGKQVSPREIDREARRALAGLEISVTLDAIRAAGADVIYTALDVADKGAVANTVRAIRQAFGPISGFVHGAGVLADRLAADKTEAEVQSVFAPKVDGLFNLLSALPEHDLTHIGLFSSASALFGNTGQADYAMANQLLVNFARAHRVRAPHIRTIAFDWGPWEGGMVDETLAGHFRAQGISLIPIAEGARIFADQLLSGDPETVEILIGDAWSGE